MNNVRACYSVQLDGMKIFKKVNMNSIAMIRYPEPERIVSLFSEMRHKIKCENKMLNLSMNTAWIITRTQ